MVAIPSAPGSIAFATIMASGSRSRRPCSPRRAAADLAIAGVTSGTCHGEVVDEFVRHVGAGMPRRLDKGLAIRRDRQEDPGSLDAGQFAGKFNHDLAGAFEDALANRHGFLTNAESI